MIFTLANILTICRLFLAPLFLVMMLTQTEWGTMSGCVVFVIAALTDWFDGYLARKYGEETQEGEFLDPLADKVLTTTAFIVFWFADLMPMWMIIVIVLRDFGMTALRSVSISNGKPLKTSQLAKLKTFLQMVFIVYVLGLMLLSQTNIWLEWKTTARELLMSETIWFFGLALTVLTVISAIEYLYKNRK